MTRVETEEDVQNVEAWAEIIKDISYLIPIDQRLDVLMLALKNEEVQKAERDARGGKLFFMTAKELSKIDTPGLRHWHTIIRFQSLVVQVLMRRIANNHSAADAKKILFVQHRYGRGSGLLEDYLPE